MLSASHEARAAKRLPCDTTTKSLHIHAEDDHDGGCARLAVTSAIVRGPRDTKVSVLLPPGGAGPAAAASARADALIPGVLVLPLPTTWGRACGPTNVQIRTIALCKCNM